MAREISTNVLVVGGGVGGVAAALAAARRAASVILIEDSRWLGGQLTTQLVPPDEHPWIEQFGGSATYRAFREGVRSYYRLWYPLTDKARRRRRLNPGSGWVGPLCHEPLVSSAVIDGLLQPQKASGRLTVRVETSPLAADCESDQIRSVLFRDEDGRTFVVHPDFVIDATETGNLLEMSQTEFVTGTESVDQTGEPHAPRLASPLNMQAFTICFAVDYAGGPESLIERPPTYGHWLRHTESAWPNPHLSWTAPNPRTLEPTTYSFDPESLNGLEDRSHIRGHRPASRDLWSYRRILAKHHFEPGAFESDVSVVNWPQNDYLGGPLYGVSVQEAAANLERARQLSLSLLYWLQNDAPRPDGGVGWPRVRARPDVAGTQDGLAMRPYVRESRRIRAEYTVVEQDVSLAVRGQSGAARYSDSVGTGYYRLDLHPTCLGDTFLDIASCPYEIPLGALLPIRVRNLVAGAKNIGTTHITNGCYRVHPTEWAIGEVAGSLAAYCVAHNVLPQQVRSDRSLLGDFQNLLASSGMALHWPDGIQAPR